MASLPPHELALLQETYAQVQAGGEDDRPLPFLDLVEEHQAARDWSGQIKTLNGWERWPMPPHAAPAYFDKEAEAAVQQASSVSDLDEKNRWAITAAMRRIDAYMARQMLKEKKG